MVARELASRLRVLMRLTGAAPTLRHLYALGKSAAIRLEDLYVGMLWFQESLIAIGIPSIADSGLYPIPSVRAGAAQAQRLGRVQTHNSFKQVIRRRCFEAAFQIRTRVSAP